MRDLNFLGVILQVRYVVTHSTFWFGSKGPIKVTSRWDLLADGSDYCESTFEVEGVVGTIVVTGKTTEKTLEDLAQEVREEVFSNPSFRICKELLNL